MVHVDWARDGIVAVKFWILLNTILAAFYSLILFLLYSSKSPQNRRIDTELALYGLTF